VNGLDPELLCSFLSNLVLDNGEHWDVKPYQRAVAVDLCDPEVNVVWLDIPEGNAKTTTAAGFALAHCFFVPDASVPLAAASRQQAMTLFAQAAGLVKRSGIEKVGKHGSGLFRVQSGHRRIECADTGATLQVFAADVDTADGVIPTMPLIEEAHRHRDLELLRTWRGKLDKRDATMLVISTAGAPGSEYEQQKDVIVSQAEPEIVSRAYRVYRADGLVLHRYGLQPGDDIEDLELVAEANPLRDVPMLREKRADPTWNRQHWARLTCGVPMADSRSAITTEEIRRLPKAEIPAGEPIAVGLDLAWKIDTTALAPMWMPEPYLRVFGRGQILIPPRDGTSMSTREVKDAFLFLHERNPIDVVAMDPSAGARQLAEWLEDPDEGLGCEVVEVSPSNVVQSKVFASWMEAIRESWIALPEDDEVLQHVLNAVGKPVSHDRYRFDRPVQSRAVRFQDKRVIDWLIAASSVHWQQTAAIEPPAPPVGPIAAVIRR
jgi:hypothetical protein